MKKIILALFVFMGIAFAEDNNYNMEYVPNGKTFAQFKQELDKDFEKNKVLKIKPIEHFVQGFLVKQGFIKFDDESFKNALEKYQKAKNIPITKEFDNLTLYYIINDSISQENKIVTPVDNKSIDSHLWDKGFVEARGTFAYKKNEDNVNIAYPEQTSRIQCFKDYKYCAMATAEIRNANNEKYLALEDYIFELISWDKYQIIAKKDYLCAREVLKINRENEEVIMDRTYINKKNEECKIFASSPNKQFTIVLQNGVTVAQELREKDNIRRNKILDKELQKE